MIISNEDTQSKHDTFNKIKCECSNDCNVLNGKCLCDRNVVDNASKGVNTNTTSEEFDTSNVSTFETNISTCKEFDSSNVSTPNTTSNTTSKDFNTSPNTTTNTTTSTPTPLKYNIHNTLLQTFINSPIKLINTYNRPTYWKFLLKYYTNNKFKSESFYKNQRESYIKYVECIDNISVQNEFKQVFSVIDNDVSRTFVEICFQDDCEDFKDDKCIGKNNCDKCIGKNKCEKCSGKTCNGKCGGKNNCDKFIGKNNCDKCIGKNNCDKCSGKNNCESCSGKTCNGKEDDNNNNSKINNKRNAYSSNTNTNTSINMNKYFNINTSTNKNNIMNKDFNINNTKYQKPNATNNNTNTKSHNTNNNTNNNNNNTNNTNTNNNTNNNTNTNTHSKNTKKCKFLDTPSQKPFFTHRQILKRLLKTFSIHNKSVGYIQGMVLTLLPIYYVLSNSTNPEDQFYAEEDTFYCFNYLMSEIYQKYLWYMSDSEYFVNKVRNILSVCDNKRSNNGKFDGFSGMGSFNGGSTNERFDGRFDGCSTNGRFDGFSTNISNNKNSTDGSNKGSTNGCSTNGSNKGNIFNFKLFKDMTSKKDNLDNSKNNCIGENIKRQSPKSPYNSFDESNLSYNFNTKSTNKSTNKPKNTKLNNNNLNNNSTDNSTSKSTYNKSTYNKNTHNNQTNSTDNSTRNKSTHYINKYSTICFRWITFLFTTEYNITDTIKLWDNLLTNDIGLDMVYFYSAAVFKILKNVLQEECFDTSMAVLQNLSVIDVENVIMIGEGIKMEYFELMGRFY